MRDKPLVSVIIIFLNAEKFIEEAIDSVFAQIYDNWELLLVDDGSTDNSAEIALRYAKQYPEKVHYLEHDSHQNRGMSASRNLGASNAKGEHIAFLDADDIWLSYKLEEQVAILQSYPDAAMVYGRAQFWRSWIEDSEDINRDHIQKGLGVEPDTLINAPTLVTVFLQDFGIPSPSGILVRHRVLKDVGGFEEAFGYNCAAFEDAALYVKICLKMPVFVADRCWYKHRIHPDSCSAIAIRTGQYSSLRSAFLNWVENYLAGQSFADGEVWEVLQKELWPYRYPIQHRLLKSTQNLIRQLKWLLKFMGRRTLPFSVYHWLEVQWEGYRRWRTAS
jgi:glycosyltransferase involved in cell wall biosynthesis